MCCIARPIIYPRLCVRIHRLSSRSISTEAAIDTRIGKFLVDKHQKLCYKQACAQEFLLGEELNEFVVGLEQRLGAQKNRLQELKKTRKQLEEEITAIKKYL